MHEKATRVACASCCCAILIAGIHTHTVFTILTAPDSFQHTYKCYRHTSCAIHHHVQDTSRMFAQPDPPFEPRRLLHFSQSSQPTQSQPHNIPSQPQPTPTGILADKLGSVTLASQPSRFRPLLSTQDLQMSQVEMLGYGPPPHGLATVISSHTYAFEFLHRTQDYVTPADDGPSEVAKLRSPAQLSPKLKRPRAVLAGTGIHT